MAVTDETRAVLAAKFEAILPHLDERQRRLLLGAEALALGHGGIRAVARAAGAGEVTVSAGIGELTAGAPLTGRVRRSGAGRKRATALDPGLRAALLALVEPDERGDPMSPLRWTTKSTRRLAEELSGQGHRVSADTVSQLLRADGFSLQANIKTIEGRQHPDRDGQFRYLNEQVKAHQASSDPVVSIDAKKKELVGPVTNTGRRWRPAGQPGQTRTHDFLDPELGKVVPYGIYDLTNDTGWVNVGTDHDTAAFAVESIRRWWNTRGRHDYPTAKRLLITADAGGSNGHRPRAFKTELAALALQTGLTITVCHFPPGTSKWNKIEHRLFSHISMNWKGRPLTSHEVIIQSIAATTTRTGLRVHAQLDTDTYNTGIQTTDRDIAALPLHRHDWHGDWNYTLPPQPPQPTNNPVTRTPFDQPSPHLAWLHHPAFTAMSTPDWETLQLIGLTLHHRQRTTGQHRRRSDRTRTTVPGTGAPPALTLPDRFIAATLHYRHRLPQTAIAALFTVRAETINIALRQTREILHQAGHTIHPSPNRIRTIHDLYTYAHTHGITPPTNIKTAC